VPLLPMKWSAIAESLRNTAIDVHVCKCYNIFSFIYIVLILSLITKIQVKYFHGVTTVMDSWVLVT
jgi:hypothetical protein